MPASGYTVITFVADELLTSTKMNQMGANDAAFNNGNGFDDGILLDRHFTDKSVTSERLHATVAFHVYNSGAGTAINPSTFTKMTFTTEIYDFGSDYASSTFTAPVTGLYWFAGRVDISTTTAQRSFTTLYKNGTEYTRGNDNVGSRGQYIGALIDLTAGDTVELYTWNDAGNDMIGGSQYLSWMQGFLIGER